MALPALAGWVVFAILAIGGRCLLYAEPTGRFLPGVGRSVGR